jgi:aminoglycoside phosphotransferase family enzyme/predicted kinase
MKPAPPADQARLIAWLRAGGPWGAPPEVVETHAALVFLIGERAFKLKKAVDLGYLDFSTLEKRHHALERELKLNRRTAHEMYRRVLPITNDNGAFAVDGRGAVIDYALEMTRFAKGALLSEMADQGKLDVALVERLAHHIAAFHADAQVMTGVDWPAAIARIAGENLRDLRAQTAFAATLKIHEPVRAKALAFGQAAFARQSNAVRRCHGDLHLANAFVDHGRPVLFDCIEFDEFYATIPPLYDLAFLLMDLSARGLAVHANRALNAWIMDQPHQHWHTLLEDLAALPAYLTLRGEIRAKTLGLKPGATEEAERYLTLATRLAALERPCLIAIGGLSGTGKSTLARVLSPTLGRAPGAIHLRTDEIRKRLAGISPDTRLHPSAYTAERGAAVYAAMEDMAKAALRAGQAVIADAVFARADERYAIEAIASDLRVPFTGVWLEAPVATLEARLERRTGDASDADAAVLHRQLTYDLGHIAWQKLDAAAGTTALADAARMAMAKPADPRA